MALFKVIVVGGSISGLALANMLEQYGIDYVVLEKHDVIAPQLGAGFAILPNGARVLEQLGCYEALEKNNEPVNSLENYDEHGTLLGSQPDMGDWMQQSFGYKMRFMDRQQVIQGLFDNLRDKSKVRNSCGAVRIVCDADGVAVETTDGSVIHGDIVVGADGICSHVKQEMQRLAAEETPGKDLFPEADTFQCTYGGFFGISKALKGTIQDQAFKSLREGRNYLCAGGPDDTLYWILMFKNDAKTRGHSIPRYTEEDRERLVTMCKDDLVKPGVTFGDLYKGQIKSAVVPLEEGVLKTCFYKRMVLVGDSWHKINPLSGLGGNNAIISAASLANELKHLIQPGESPDEEDVQSVFRNYQKTRQGQARRLVEMASLMQRMEALETPLLKFIQLRIAAKTSIGVFINSLAQWFAPAVRLKYLPLPSRLGLLPFNDEVKIKPKSRPKPANAVWVLMLALLILVHYPLIHQESSTTSGLPALENVKKYWGITDGPKRSRLYFNISMTAVTTIMCIESYRQYFFLKLVGSVLPLGIASLFIGWEIIAPIYFALFIHSTAPKAFYYPSIRALDMAMLTSIVYAYLVTYVPVFIYTCVSPAFPSKSWTIAHATLPLTIQLFRGWTAKRLTTKLRSPALLHGAEDVPLLSTFMGFLYGIQAAGVSETEFHLVRRLSGIYYFGYRSTITGDVARAMLLDLAIGVFLIFAYWDLRRVGASVSNPWHLVAAGILISVLFSPAATLPLLWRLRERQWAEARKREMESITEV